MQRAEGVLLRDAQRAGCLSPCQCFTAPAGSSEAPQEPLEELSGWEGTAWSCLLASWERSSHPAQVGSPGVASEVSGLTPSQHLARALEGSRRGLAVGVWLMASRPATRGIREPQGPGWSAFLLYKENKSREEEAGLGLGLLQVRPVGRGSWQWHLSDGVWEHIGPDCSSFCERPSPSLFCFVFVFLGLHPKPMEVPRLGVELEL